MLSEDTKMPLFPLELVLFPGMMLPLHIFEPRYKAMIKECLGSGQPFGVVLVKRDTDKQQADVKNRASFGEMYNVGTTAHITAVEHLDDGRMNLITVGQDRFVIKDVNVSEEDFFVGQVDPFPMVDAIQPEKAEFLTGKLRPIVQRYIENLAQASGENLSDTNLPTDPVALAYLAGTAIQGPLADKQRLLSTQSLQKLILKTLSLLDREDQILAYMLKAHNQHHQIERLPFVDYSLN